MKNSYINSFSKFFKSLLTSSKVLPFFVLHSLFFLVACEKIIMHKKDIDLEIMSFPPKLVVRASLDGSNGNLSIRLSEGRSLTDYKKPISVNLVVERQGTIRLFEEGDHELIWSQSGIFELPVGYSSEMMYRIDAPGIVTYPGKTYRLEVEADIDGSIEKVTATATMPHPPEFSATTDTTIVITVPYEKIFSFGWGSGNWSGNKYWPVILNFDKYESERNYYTVEMMNSSIEQDVDHNLLRRGVPNCVYVSDLFKLQDNPEKEFFFDSNINGDNSNSYDLFCFSTMMMSSLSFSRDNTSMTLYTGYYPVREELEDVNNSNTDSYDQYEATLYHNKLILRVRQTTDATFKYYRSMIMYRPTLGGGFFGMGDIEPPENIVGNIKGGYGCFMVYNSIDIVLLDYKIYR